MKRGKIRWTKVTNNAVVVNDRNVTMGLKVER